MLLFFCIAGLIIIRIIIDCYSFPALQGTQAREKNELLIQKFGIDYSKLPLMFRQGSSIFRVKVTFSPYHIHSTFLRTICTNSIAVHLVHTWLEQDGLTWLHILPHPIVLIKLLVSFLPSSWSSWLEPALA